MSTREKTLLRVYCSGMFDLMHYGHLKLFQKCKNVAEEVHLIIGVHGDGYETQNYKRLPVMTLEERVESVRATGMADEIVPDAPIFEPRDFYQKFRVDMVVHAHRPDMHDYYLKHCYAEAEALGIFHRVDYETSISTTDLIQRIISRHENKQF
jgi:choline-phosphate cytidylyltransferase